MKKIHYYTLPLFGFCLKGNVYALAQLSAKFQIWSREFGLSDIESIALFAAGSTQQKVCGFSQEQLVEIAEEAFSKLPKQKEGEWLDLE